MTLRFLGLRRVLWMGLRRSVLSLGGVGWFPLLSGMVLDGGGLRGAHGSQEERRRQNESRRRGTVQAGYTYIYIYMLCSNTFRIFVFELAYSLVWRFLVCVVSAFIFQC